MEDELKPRKQVNEMQLNGLIEYMKEHQELAKGLTRGRRGKLHTLKLWNHCSKKLNAVKSGAVKDGKGWAKYWCDWKYRVRRRALELKAANSGGGLSVETTPLSPMEEIMLDIIGENNVEGVVVKADPLGEVDSDANDGLCDETSEENNQFYDTRSRNLKRKHSSNGSADEVGSSSRIKLGNNEKDEYNIDNDEDTQEFLRIERAKLENSNKMVEALERTTSAATRIADVLTHIRDVIVNNRLNII